MGKKDGGAEKSLNAGEKMKIELNFFLFYLLKFLLILKQNLFKLLPPKIKVD